MPRLPSAAMAFAVALVVARPLVAGPLPVGIVGDSISDPYKHYQGGMNPATGLPFWGSGGDRNWVELATSYTSSDSRPVYNYGEAGFTGSELAAPGGSADKLALRVKNDGVGAAVVQFGANDLLDFLTGNPGGDPATVVGSIAGNLDAILTKAQTAGPIKAVVVNVPDLTVTPSMKYLLGTTPGALVAFQALIQATNAAMAQVAAGHGATVVDSYGISHLTDGALAMGGTTVPAEKYFAPDGFHPATALQGLLGNAIWEAFGSDFDSYKLDDHSILMLAGIPHDEAQARGVFTDVSAFVLPPGGVQDTPEPATLVLAGLGFAALGVRRLRRTKVLAA